MSSGTTKRPAAGSWDNLLIDGISPDSTYRFAITREEDTALSFAPARRPVHATTRCLRAGWGSSWEAVYGRWVHFGGPAGGRSRGTDSGCRPFGQADELLAPR